MTETTDVPPATTPLEQVAAVQRTVGTRPLPDGEGRTVSLARTYAVALGDVWDACTNPERIPRWFLPVSGELRLGGRYQLEGQAGGIVESCDPPHGFTVTWEYAGEVSWVELRLTELSDERTRFELVHVAPADDERWAEFGPGAVGMGWDLLVVGLTMHLPTGAAVTEEGAAWMGSPDGLEFMSRSSQAWYAAHVAAGASESFARAAAERTLAAYTGPPAE